MSDIHFQQTQYGFEWGSAKIQRHCSDDKRGCIWMGIETPKSELQIYVTKTGKVRVYKDGVEMKEGDRTTPQP